jgi:hypothetical protein
MRTALVWLLAVPCFCEPRLLLNQQDFVRISRIAAAQPWAARLVQGIVRFADEWPAQYVREYGLKEWDIPREGGGWSHAYVCPDHGVRLQQRGGRNLCPIDGKDYHGYPIDNVVYSQRAGANADAVRQLGLAYRLTGRQEYAEKARRILMAYADLYPTLPVHDNNNRRDTRTGARVMSQTLSEASWMVPLAFGYDLVRDAFSAEDRSHIENSLLRNAAAVIRKNNAGKSNWQSWHNAALLAIGLLVGDRELTALAIDAPTGGFRFQLRESITSDGPWFEGSWGYHFYALQPLLLTREMAERARLAVPEAAVLKRMLDAPLMCVFPDGTLPNFNDSGYTSLASEARWYDVGYRMFGDPRYLPIAAQGGRTVEGLMWGAESLGSETSPELGSTLLPEAGVAVLRVKGSDHTLAIKYGPHGGGHGHFDKLSFISYADGTRLAVDPGTQAYAAKTHATWDKMTVAHNTISVDGKVQAAATGKLLEWVPLPGATLVRLDGGPAYPGITLERTIVLTAEYAIDSFRATAAGGEAHRYDWLYHNYGAITTPLPLEPYSAMTRENGYQHLTGTKGAATGEAWSVVFGQKSANLLVRMLGEPGTEVVTGEGLGPDLRVPVPFVMARRNAPATRFVALLEPYRERPVVSGFTASAVAMGETRDEYTLAPFSLVRTRQGRPVRVILAAGAKHRWLENGTGAALEADWSGDGKTLDVYAQVGELRAFAPDAVTVRRNGVAVAVTREGDFVRLR